MSRDELQELAAHKLAKDKRLLCQWATGVGKSGVVLRFLRDNPDFRCLILVPEQTNIENWRTEFQKFGISDNNVDILCYASLHKVDNTRWDLLVLDEVPHIDTDKRSDFLSTVSAEYVLALGALVDDEELNILQTLYGKFCVSYISLERAIQMGILPGPKVYVLHMSMDDTKPTH